MRNHAIHIIEWLKELAESIATTLLILVFSRWFVRLPLQEGPAACVVLGNGPSLTSDLAAASDLLPGKTLCCVNNFVFSDLYSSLRPSVYLILDHYYWSDDQPSHLLEERERFYQQLESKTSWPLVLLAPFQCAGNASWKRRGGIKNPNVRVIFFNKTPLPGFTWFRHLCYRLELGMPLAQNVLVAAVFLAVNMGYKKIYILGADHSWHEDLVVGQDNRLYVRQSHFYDSKEVTLEPVYKSAHELFNMYDIFLAWAKVFKGHKMVEEYARSRGVKVWNAGKKSYIDAFERYDLNQERQTSTR